ncbi:MAG TPA: carbohydrate-binding protein [Marinilabiliales bacterium]|nr:carbohydrate-binding protein [Marinilabiliales bacterium]
MKQPGIFLLLLVGLYSCQTQPEPETFVPATTCNPINISYRFCTDEPSRREAADPTVVWFRGRYILFASKSGGYWHSTDLKEWTFVETYEIPTEEYAPTAIAINDTLYFLASSNEQSTLYYSTDPLSGKWNVAKEKLEVPVWDPALFLDDDQRLYLFWGCSNVNSIYGVELDYHNNFNFMGKPTELIHTDTKIHGWEVPGDFNTLTQQSPWIEGAWINKHNGTYYLQYAGPGTEFKSYSDAVYVSENPLGPYTVQPHNPFAYKPEGFTSGAGHGSTFKDRYGNYWHIGTSTISIKHVFERRLGLYPAFFDSLGTLYTVTAFGDYPMIIPQKKISGFNEIFPGWMLLSYNKKVEVSSAIDTLPALFMTDEDIRTYWAAASGNANEFATLDLGSVMEVYAVQLNFAEHRTTILGRQKNLFHRYMLECSSDGSHWTLLADKSENTTDNSHDYMELNEKVACRFLKVTNVQVPGGNFAISGFRVFGKGNGTAPEAVQHVEATRNPEDKKQVTLHWEKSGTATGYNIHYGIAKDQLYQNYQVYEDTAVTIRSLNANLDYYFTIESFNENGLVPGGVVVSAK